VSVRPLSDVFASKLASVRDVLPSGQYFHALVISSNDDSLFAFAARCIDAMMQSGQHGRVLPAHQDRAAGAAAVHGVVRQGGDGMDGCVHRRDEARHGQRQRVRDVLVAAVPDAAQLPARAHVGDGHVRCRQDEEAVPAADAPERVVCGLQGHSVV